MSVIPQAAVDAAMKSAEAGYGVAAKAAAGQIRYALEAAAPLIIAAERERVAQLEALAAEILASYHKTSDGYRGRVGQVQIAKWQARLGGQP